MASAGHTCFVKRDNTLTSLECRMDGNAAQGRFRREWNMMQSCAEMDNYRPTKKTKKERLKIRVD